MLHGKLKRQRFDENTSIEDFRRRCEQAAAKYQKIPKVVAIANDNIKGMKAEWIIPNGAKEEKLILYVHGGGYVSGSCSDHRGFVSKFANRCGVMNLLYEYRLAPEHPFPAALDDSINIYNELLARGKKPENIILAGESAGGG